MLEDFLNKEKTISGSHYSGEIEKKEDETRYDALKSYTRQAKMDYQSYIDKGQPEDVEEHFSDEQIKRIKEYNWLETFKTKEGLVSNFRMKMKKAAKLQGSIRRFEKLEGTKDFNKKELAKLMAEYLKTKQNIDEMVQGAGHVLEYAHRFIVNKEKKYYHEFKPLQRLERHLTKLLKKPVGLTSSLHEIYDKKMKNLVNLDKLKGLISNSEEARNISEKRENIKKEALFWSDVRDAERHIANDLYETQGYNKDEEFKEYVKQHSVHIEDEELIKEMEDFLSKGVKKEVKDKEDFVSKEHLKETLRNISKELNETWKDERIVRKRCYKEIIDNMIAQDKSGDQVLETPRIIKLMNDISETESVHTETPVGAVLVGPPGTGKSLGIEHYLATDPEHRTKPSPVIIDMSQETSEYVLLGGEQVDLSDKASTVKHLNSLVKERESIEFDIKNEEDEDTKRLFEQQLDTLNKHLEDIIHFSLGVDLDK